MDGYRITESGDLRLSESGDTRITEQVSFAEASLSATGSKIVAAHSIQLVETSLVSSSSVSAKASRTTLTNFGGYAENSIRVTEAGDTRVTEEGDTRLTLFAPAEESVSSLSALASRTRSITISLNGVSTSVYSGFVNRPASADYTGTGSSIFLSNKVRPANTNLLGTGTSVSDGSRIRSPALFGGFPEDPVRILENGDTRITEDGNTRVATNVIFNSASGTLIVDGTIIKFVSVVYIKQDDEWVQLNPYVQYNSNWQQPQKVHRYTDGVWKRIN